MRGQAACADSENMGADAFVRPKERQRRSVIGVQRQNLDGDFIAGSPSATSGAGRYEICPENLVGLTLVALLLGAGNGECVRPYMSYSRLAVRKPEA